MRMNRHWIDLLTQRLGRCGYPRVIQFYRCMKIPVLDFSRNLTHLQQFCFVHYCDDLLRVTLAAE